MSMLPSNKEAWVTALLSYQTVLVALCDSKGPEKGLKLKELDHWMWNDLRNDLVTKKFMTHDQLTKLMTWKLSRGSFRPSLLSQVSSNPVQFVETVSRAAFELLDQSTTLAALKELTKLKGVGPATASAILSAFDESVPFMSDESLCLIYSKNKIPYTAKAYEALLTHLRGLSERLNKETDTESEQWTPGSCERAVWAFNVEKRLGLGSLTALRESANSAAAAPEAKQHHPGNKRARDSGPAESADESNRPKRVRTRASIERR
ncbi:hypothetical protein HDU85_001392 [Gaertneriomyces sp. JEL0708]|nr:hypothetical protein HDU85_001392 [Gaertneriomyces sp. JEL0708]